MMINYEAEQSILGAILKENTIIDTLRLRPTHLGTATHQILYDAMIKLNEDNKPVDPITLSDQLGDNIENVGGIKYLVDLTDSVATFETVKFHEELILQSYQSRKLRELSLQNAENPDYENIEETIKNLEDIRNVISDDYEADYQSELKSIAQEMGEVKDLSSLGYKTGFNDYDRLTGGLQKGDLIIVGARPSIGKTAFGLNMGTAHCSKGGTTHIFSMEMGLKPIIKRLINMTGNIKSTAWHMPQFSVSDYERGINAVGIMSEWNMNVYSRINSVSGIKAKMRRVMQEQPDKNHLVVIDHLGEFEKRGGFDRNDLEVGNNVKQLRDMAKEHNVPVILLSQLGRGVEQRQDKRPMMSDLRDSGEIEQYADVIALLYRDDYYDSDSEQQNIIEVIISKQRDGPTGTVELAFIKDYGRFVNLEYRYD